MTAKHLHPLAILPMIWKNLVNVVFSILIVFGLFKVLKQWQYFTILGIVVSLAVLLAILKYWCLTYELGNQAITIHSGVIFRQQVHIPYNRIQTLQLKQWFYMKPFHVFAVSIETAGQSHAKAEGQLPMVAKDVVDQLQAIVNGDSQTFTATANEMKPSTVYRISWSDLNAYAITSMGIMPILVALGWLYDKLDDVLPQKWLNAVFSRTAHISVLLIVGAVIGVLILGILISYLIIIQRYYHFQLVKRDQRLLTEKGFFQRNTIVASLDRIQAVVISQTILRQWLKLVSVQVILASSAADNEDQNNLVMMPVVKQQHYDQTHTFIPWLPQALPTYTRISPWAKWLLIRNAVMIAIVPVLILGIVFRPWGWLSLVVLPIAVGLGAYSGQNMGVAILSPQLMSTRDGHFFKRSTYLIPRHHIQAMMLKQSVWMKRAQLAHLQLELRHGDSVQKVEVRYLPIQAARSLYQWYRR
ncbi:PH domain-containing protein [Secundilactobacillus hailunensis]|uniref:PH domain-containing protein n=1 Tax=Secundilactobacillus hailunensis TaxID=2559923 RepID=A0ABW1TER5_9LACO|nr:PH domain-containing protein [Secundilactobacillus hailunensis]